MSYGKKKTRVTLKDVADLADVSAQTVSRVIRGRGSVSPETEQKVLETARNLNYIPSYAAKALRSGTSRNIAVVFDSLRNIYFAVMIDYLRCVISRRGYSVQLIFSENPVITEQCYHKAISHGAVAVISFLESEVGLGETVKNCGIPLMVFGRSTTEDGMDYITTDDTQGGRMAAEYLLGKGCTTFHYVVEGRGMTCALDRFEGFRTELAHRGYEAKLVDTGTFGEDALSVIDFSDPREGVFCFCDSLAFRVMQHIKKRGGASRAKLIGYDNIQEDLVLPVRLASIGIDKNSHAEFAVDKLIEKLSHPDIVIAERQKVRLFE